MCLYQLGPLFLFAASAELKLEILNFFAIFFFSVSVYLILKGPNQSVGPLMAGDRSTLLRLALKATKLPRQEVGNWSFDVLYVFFLISRNSLMFILIY